MHVVDPARASCAFISVFQLLVSVATPRMSVLLCGRDNSRATLAFRWLRIAGGLAALCVNQNANLTEVNLPAQVKKMKSVVE